MCERRISEYWLAAVLCALVLLAGGPIIFSPLSLGGGASPAWAAEDDELESTTTTENSTDKKSSGETSADEKGADAKAADEKTADEKGTDAKTADAKAADAKGTDEKTADAKAADAKGADAKGADAEVADDKEIDEKADSGKSPRSKESFLVWLYKSLGTRYVVIFLIITFNAVALIVMIVLGVRRNVICPDDLVAAFEAKLNEKQYQEAYEIAKGDHSLLGKVLAAGMAKVPDGYDQAMEAMQEVGEAQNMKLEQRNGYIALIAQIGPMFGLLGTVDGMVMAFDVISNSNVTPKPSELAQGIGTALVTTVVGLWISIPCIVFYHVIRNRLTRLILETGVVGGGLMKRFASAQTSIKKS